MNVQRCALVYFIRFANVIYFYSLRYKYEIKRLIVPWVINATRADNRVDVSSTKRSRP
jgi:hypothetical protein